MKLTDSLRRLSALARVVLALAVLAAGTIDADAQKKKSRSSAAIKKEQQATKSKIAKTNQQLTANDRRTSRTLNELSIINVEIADNRVLLNKLQHRLDSLNGAKRALTDTIRRLDSRLNDMQRAYAASVRATSQAKQSKLGRLAFIFSSESFNQAYRRMRYMEEYSQWQRRRTVDIRTTRAQLDERRLRLDTLLQRQQAVKAEVETAQTALADRQRRTEDLAKKLKRENRQLKKVLADQKTKAAELDRELDRVIAEEIARQQAEERRRQEAERRRQEAERKAAQKAATKDSKGTAADKPSTAQPAATQAPKPAAATPKPVAADPAVGATFEASKGSLQFPVAGNYKIVRTFGRQKHPQLPNVVIDNSGIDIEAAKGTRARAVYGGTVSAIFRQSGYNDIVMVRHGSYLTIYANLTNVSVKKGQHVDAGQALGTIYPNPDNAGKPILHFEIRHEKEKLNPLLWVKH